MAKSLRLKGMLSASGSISLDKKILKRYYKGLISPSVTEKDPDLEVNLVVYPVTKPVISSVNKEHTSTEFSDSDIDTIARKQKVDKDAVRLLLSSRNSISGSKFRENVLNILNG